MIEQTLKQFKRWLGSKHCPIGNCFVIPYSNGWFFKLVVDVFKPSIQRWSFCVCQGFKTFICQNISPIYLLFCVWQWVITPHKSTFFNVGHFYHLIFTF
jgi:hypothetical protein